MLMSSLAKKAEAGQHRPIRILSGGYTCTNTEENYWQQSAATQRLVLCCHIFPWRACVNTWGGPQMLSGAVGGPRRWAPARWLEDPSKRWIPFLIDSSFATSRLLLAWQWLPLHISEFNTLVWLFIHNANATVTGQFLEKEHVGQD